MSQHNYIIVYLANLVSLAVRRLCFVWAVKTLTWHNHNSNETSNPAGASEH